MIGNTEQTYSTYSSLESYIPTPMKKFHGYVFTQGKILSQTAASKTLDAVLRTLGSSRAAQATAIGISFVVYSILFAVSQLAHLAPLAIIGGYIATTLILLYVCPPAGFTLIGLFGAATTAGLAKTHFWPSSDNSDSSSQGSYDSDFERCVQEIQECFKKLTSECTTTKGPTTSNSQRTRLVGNNTCLIGCSKSHPSPSEEDDITHESGHDRTSPPETTLDLHTGSNIYDKSYLEDSTTPEPPDIDEALERADLSGTLYATYDVYEEDDTTSSTSSSSTTFAPYDDSSNSEGLRDVVGTGGVLDFSSHSNSSSPTPQLPPTSTKGKLQQMQEWLSDAFFPKSLAEQFDLEEDFLSDDV